MRGLHAGGNKSERARYRQPSKKIKELPKFKVRDIVPLRITRNKTGMSNICQTVEFVRLQMKVHGLEEQQAMFDMWLYQTFSCLYMQNT